MDALDALESDGAARAAREDCLGLSLIVRSAMTVTAAEDEEVDDDR